MGYKGRDIEVVQLEGSQLLVTACDSCGAIGSKEYDCVNVPFEMVGRFTVRVALLEVMAAGARPQIISAAICNELHPAGQGMMNGIKDELGFLQMKDIPVVWSTEKNMVTRQTGLGITVVGVCSEQQLRVALSCPGDTVYLVGLPKVGNEVKGPEDPEMAQGSHIQLLLKDKTVHDILPIGSRGILQEAEGLAAAVNHRFLPDSMVSIDLEKSAGPSTCLVFTGPSTLDIDSLQRTPVRRIGTII